MSHFHQITATVLAMILMAGCASESSDEPPTAAAESALVGGNALVPNALIPNALIPNALVPNALIPNALIPNALVPNALQAIRDAGAAGEVSRELLRFTVSCALTPAQIFSFSWTDSAGVLHEEAYPGLLGLAPSWASGPLNDTGQRIVSACLAARANYSGASVLVSMRSEYDRLDDQTTWQELSAYPYLEGAFWGNVFAATPHLHACYVPTNVNHARAALRECASGHPNPSGGPALPCGPIVVEGACSSICSRFDASDKLYDRCLDKPGSGSTSRTSLVITTALP